MKDLERQRWLAGLSLLAAVPLPVTGIATWPFVLPFAATAIWVLVRRRVVEPLPPWLENVLAPVVLVAVVAAGGMQVGVLRPVSHLALLVAAIRLPGAARPGRARLTLTTAAIIGAAGIASSTHPSLVAYLLLMLAVCTVAAGRAILLDLMSRTQETAGGAAWPPVRLVVLTLVLAAVIAVPLFAALPRLRSPFVGARSGSVSVSGFRSEVTLHGIGAIKVSERPALTVRFPEAGEAKSGWLRLEGATLNYYRGGTWVEGRNAQPLPLPRRGQAVAVWAAAEGGPLRRAEITLEKESENLFVPVGTVELEPPLSVEVSRTAMGVLRLPPATGAPLRYAAMFDPAQPRSPPPDEIDLEVPAPVRERIAPLVHEVVGEALTPLAIASALEAHLRSSYGYTLRPQASWREDPVVWFLLRGREGHCEFFASAMALMLRVAGVPARIQVGFAGGELQPDGSFLVRDSHAHAWVLVWMGDRWQVFDPTPPEGQPLAPAAKAGLRLLWRWEDAVAAWDRWVLTFTLFDQADIARSVAAWLTSRPRVVWPAVALALVVAAWSAWRRRLRSRQDSEARRGRRREEAVVRVLEGVLAAGARHGLEVSPAASPRAFGAAAAAAFPAAAPAVEWLVQAHERRRYGGGEAPSRRELRRCAAEIERAMAAGHVRTKVGSFPVGGTGPASHAASHQAAARNGIAASTSTR